MIINSFVKMKMKRTLTSSQLKKFKLISGAFAVTVLFAVLSDQVASQIQAYEGDYVWQGKKYNQLLRSVTSTGYIDEY